MEFMSFMRANFPDVIKGTHPKYGSIIITEDDVKEEHVRAQEHI